LKKNNIRKINLFALVLTFSLTFCGTPEDDITPRNDDKEITEEDVEKSFQTVDLTAGIKDIDIKNVETAFLHSG